MHDENDSVNHHHGIRFFSQFSAQTPIKRLTVGSPIITGGSLSLLLWLLDLSGERRVELVECRIT